MAAQLQNCSCDPIWPTVDYDESKCIAFFSVFFCLQLLLLLFLVLFFCVGELRSSHKAILWRVLFACSLIAQSAKVLRTGLLLNPAYRCNVAFKMELFLYALYNTHLCFSSVCFVSLLFFWARLYHDLVPSKKIFGKLTPAYVFVFIFLCFFYYVEVVIISRAGGAASAEGFSVATGLVTFSLAASYIVYGLLLWQTFFVAGDRTKIFFKMFLSAFTSSIVMIVLDAFLLAFYFVSFSSTTNQYLVRHGIYESLYFVAFLSFLSGFVVHFVTHGFAHTGTSNKKSSTESSERRIAGSNEKQNVSFY